MKGWTSLGHLHCSQEDERRREQSVHLQRKEEEDRLEFFKVQRQRIDNDDEVKEDYMESLTPAFKTYLGELVEPDLSSLTPAFHQYLANQTLLYGLNSSYSSESNSQNQTSPSPDLLWLPSSSAGGSSTTSSFVYEDERDEVLSISCIEESRITHK